MLLGFLIFTLIFIFSQIHAKAMSPSSDVPTGRQSSQSTTTYGAVEKVLYFYHLIRHEPPHGFPESNGKQYCMLTQHIMGGYMNPPYGYHQFNGASG